MSLTLTTGECAAVANALRTAAWSGPDALRDRIERAAVPRQGNAAGKRFERRIAKELRLIVASLPGEWKVARNQTDRQKGQVADGAGEYTIEGPVRFSWTFELKDGSGFKIPHLFAEPIPGPLASTPKREGFWAQARRQAACVGRQPILIVREGARDEHEFAILRPEHRDMLIGREAVKATIELEGERLDVCLWRTLRNVPADRWILPLPPSPGA